MKVRVVKPFSRFSIGAIIPEMPAGQARTMIARGLVVEDVERDIMRAPADRMMRPPPAQARVRKAGVA